MTSCLHTRRSPVRSWLAAFAGRFVKSAIPDEPGACSPAASPAAGTIWTIGGAIGVARHNRLCLRTRPPAADIRRWQLIWERCACA